MNFEGYAEIIGLSTITSGIVAAITDYYLTKRKRKKEARYTVTEAHLKTVLELAYWLCNYGNIIPLRPEIDSKEKLISALHLEWTRMILYASNDTIRKMKTFLKEPTEEHYLELALKLRSIVYPVGDGLTRQDIVM